MSTVYTRVKEAVRTAAEGVQHTASRAGNTSAVQGAARLAAQLSKAAAEAALAAPGVRKGVDGARQAWLDAKKAAEARLEKLEADAWAWIHKMQAEARRQARQAERRIEARDHAAVLGVAADADLDAIKKAYRLKMREHHPDKFAHDPAAEARAHAESQRIIEAYQQLTALHTGREDRRGQ